MKAKVLKDFKDKYTGKRYTAGEIITVSKERFDEILTVDKLVEEVPFDRTAEANEEAVEKAVEKPKKTARKATKKPAK